MNRVAPGNLTTFPEVMRWFKSKDLGEWSGQGLVSEGSDVATEETAAYKSENQGSLRAQGAAMFAQGGRGSPRRQKKKKAVWVTINEGSASDVHRVRQRS